MKKAFCLLLKITGGAISLLLATLILCIIFGVTVDLSFLRPGVEKAATSAIGREVKIQGPVVFEFAHWTAIDVRDVQVANLPNAKEPDFFKAGLARLEIGLTHLLKGEIHISEVIAEDVILNLESDAKGEPNWVFGKPKAEAQAENSETVQNTPQELQEDKKSKENRISFGGLDKLSFKRIALTYHDDAIKKTFKSQLESMTGEMSSGKPILLSMNGHIHKTLFDLHLKGDPFDHLAKKEKPWSFRLDGDVAGKKLAAKGNLLRGKEPGIDMAFGVKDVDVGNILSVLGLVDGMSASVGDAAFKVLLKGKSLQQVLRESSMFFTVKEGQWKINLPNSKNSFDITRLNGEIKVEKGNAITMDLSGNLKDEPVNLLITGSPLVDYMETPDKIPLTIDAKLANMKLQFASTLALPITTKDLKLALKLSGERLDSVNRLFKLDLPPVGPLALDARLQVTDKGYNLSKLDIKIGKTSLNGKMILDISQKKPKLDIELVSDSIQINDFDAGKKKKVAKNKGDEKKSAAKKMTQKEKQKIRKLLSQEVMGLIDADIKIVAKQVLSGKDKLGSASANLTLKKSRLAIEPLKVNLPGGRMQVDFSFLPGKNSATIDLKTKINKFDIGVIARRVKPGTDMGGFLYLDAQLHSVAPNLKQMMKNAKGHFDFGLVPKNFSSGIIDLWAVNLLSAVMDKETEKDKSTVNCFIMRFGMQDGLMRDKIIYMDTTEMRVTGEAGVNFKTETIDMMMIPKSKKPEFFSLATPIQIKGTFEDFGLKLGVGKLLGTVISFVTSPVHVPIRRIFVDEIPSDGKDACLRAWKYTGEIKNVEKKKTIFNRINFNKKEKK